ncbi:mitochondrial/chloroplast ribosomal protein L54/L37 [Postia placenta Mad-698-R]|uniref:Large ribosomal subunit protein mL54 n=2 Tax=Rhodonia placenta TaxID=104341 RepID=A0A1X6NAJ1_9APHY|nr:hypothetical protein POSPLADRAFT_1167651 [Postia placenta MAD-698-R-SB12]EED79295.1 mitochondrial/chloroplast ribosomal protein L54/L37 [Postia placenta Mad-698-R]KAF9819805.1 hypothetical protein IEO21_01896 [Postia placenta]OSX65393.1 hypothetical protein POSPLADRAFT_1167651 [Postia placenta MAD-698-R-SB12]
MSLLHTLRRPPVFNAWYPARRCFASSSKTADAALAAPAIASEAKKVDGAEAVSRSSCPEGTILTGMSYLKNQQPVTAMADDAYPEWLWKLLEPKQLPDDGPGGKAEKYMLRKQNRRKIRDQNFMKTQ